jgi:WD40 repeat protein
MSRLSHGLARGVGLLVLLLAGGGCSGGAEPEAAAPAARLVFLRDAILTAPGAGGRTVGGGREILERTWTPGEEVTAGGRTDPAPARPECVPLFSQVLGDVDSLISRGVATPGTALAWSPDGNLLAVGSYVGEVLILDGWTGEIRARRSLAETMVKQVAWSPDGRTVYAGEQSPDAYVHALDATDLSPRWSFALSDDLESSPPPAETDIYGVFTLPAAYGLIVLNDGDLLVAGMHSWTTGADVKRNLGRLYRLSPEGEVRVRWPSGAPADATLRYPRVDHEAGLVAFPLGRTASGPAPADLPIDGIQVLNLETLEAHASFVNEPLKPHFQFASVWEAIDIHDGRVLVGFGDGRAQLVPLAGGDRITLELGTPIISGEVPIAAAVSWGEFTHDGGLVVNTGTSNIPWGSDVTASRPPVAHPGENTVWAYDRDGQLRWNWQSEAMIQGLSLSPDGRWLVMGGGPRQSDARRDLFGAWLFRLEGEGSGADRLEVVCPTGAPVFFHHAMTDDGRIAVSEVPYKNEAGGRVLGEYRVTVLR